VAFNYHCGNILSHSSASLMEK